MYVNVNLCHVMYKAFTWRKLWSVACTGGGRVWRRPSLEFRPLLSIPGGVSPTADLVQRGRSPWWPIFKENLPKNFLAPCGRRFCNFLLDFRPPLGKSRPPPEGGRKCLKGGRKKSRAPKLFILNVRPPRGKSCARTCYLGKRGYLIGGYLIWIVSFSETCETGRPVWGPVSLFFHFLHIFNL